MQQQDFIHPCAKVFFIVEFDIEEDHDLILSLGLLFWGNLGLFMKRQSPFNPASDTLSSTPLWVRLPNLPLHFCGLPTLELIGSTLEKFHFESHETTRYNTSTFARICVEMDFSKGFPTKVILTGKSYSWSQKLDYERISLRCRSCFEIGHLASHCPKGPKKNRKPKKSTWWVGSSDDHQVISKPQSNKNMSHPDLPPLPNPSQKSTKELSSPQISDEGP